jgi:hypothetical protein
VGGFGVVPGVGLGGGGGDAGGLVLIRQRLTHLIISCQPFLNVLRPLESDSKHSSPVEHQLRILTAVLFNKA